MGKWEDEDLNLKEIWKEENVKLFKKENLLD